MLAAVSGRLYQWDVITIPEIFHKCYQSPRIVFVPQQTNDRREKWKDHIRGGVCQNIRAKLEAEGVTIAPIADIV